MSAELIKGLRARLAPENLLTGESERVAYGYDNSRRHALPDAVAFPLCEQDVIAVTALCYQLKVPLIARGKGTGTTGATVPVHGGVVLSFERMSQILSIDPDNRSMVVEPGVTNAEVQSAAAEHGFFWPPDPTSSAVCTVGGNLAYNTAGPRAVKYGTPRDNILGLRAVTGTGQLIQTGVSTTKGVVGYDLTRLLIGSEGTLGLITRATLKLTPQAETKRTLRVLYRDMHAAARAVAAIMAQSVTPCALEFLDGEALRLARGNGADIPEQARGMLMIEVDGPDACIDTASQALQQAARVEGCLEVMEASDPKAIKQLWDARSKLSPALRRIAPRKINEDIVVPVSRIPELIDGIQALSSRYGILIVNFGHAGNGNLHTNLLIDPDDPQQMAVADECLDALFNLVLKLDGTLSGEHGIGLVKREFVDREITAPTLEVMHAIRRQFDPRGILNPGKTLPDDPTRLQDKQ